MTTVGSRGVTNVVKSMFLLIPLSISPGAFSAEKDVVVVNPPSRPVPVAVQGSTNVNGTVSVANFPGTQAVTVTNFPATQPVSVANLPDTLATAPAGTPITLQNELGLNAAIGSSEHVVLREAGAGSKTHLKGQIAIGSISVAAKTAGASPGEVSLDFMATNCAGGGHGVIRRVILLTGSTAHLDFPTPQWVPAVGPRDPFCVEVDVLNGHHAEDIDITVVGSLR